MARANRKVESAAATHTLVVETPSIVRETTIYSEALDDTQFSVDEIGDAYAASREPTAISKIVENRS